MFENETVLTKRLCLMFNIVNLIEKRKFNLFTSPFILVIIGGYFIIKDNNFSMLTISLLLLAIITPITIIVVNHMLVRINYSKYTKYKKIHYAFDASGIKIMNLEDKEKKSSLSEKILIEWNMIKQITQYREFYIVSFKKGEPLVLSRNGFIDNCEREFCSFIENKIKRRL